MKESDESEDVVPMVFRSQVLRLPGRGKRSEPSQQPTGLTIRLSRMSHPNLPAEVIRLRQSTVVVGRGDSCDLPLSDDAQLVSERHAEISVHEGRVTATDLESRNFTRLNGRVLEPGVPCEVGPDSIIVIGDYTLQVEPGHLPGRADVRADEETSPVNPFVDLGTELAQLLARISELYYAQPLGSRADALREALETALEESSPDAALEAVARALEDRGRTR